jgi:putative transposon-encoded protein
MANPKAAGEIIQEGISPLYYFFRALLEVKEGGGRTAGRKFGVVQEIVVRKLLEQSALVDERMLFERRLPGFSGALHKVEFILYGLKKRVPVGGTIRVRGLEVNYLSYEDGVSKVHWRVPADSKFKSATIKSRSTITLSLAKELVARNIALLLPPGKSVISLLDTSDVLASIESKRVGAQIFVGSEKLGSGIQTIEKAKQTSLVAIDADLKFNKVIRPIVIRDGADPETRRFISIVTLGNGVHWTAHDHNIFRTYVDHTYLVRDEVMMNYGKFVKKLAEKAGVPVPKFFMGYFDGMTIARPDAFVVDDGDLSVIEPADDVRPINAILNSHIEKHNHVD